MIYRSLRDLHSVTNCGNILGLLYWSTIENWNLLSNNEEFAYGGVNPCAEEPLPPGGSCLLGSINLSAFVKNKKFNFQDFANTVRIATYGLNQVLEEGLPLHPLEEQRKSVGDWRQIGLGVMGIADMLIQMEIKYDTQTALDICQKIASIMINNALQESALIAKEKGTYPKYNDKILDSDFFKDVANQETKQLVSQYGLRNSQLLTIAPTGTLSTMLGISGGIEPIFANSYTRKTESLHGKDVYYKVYTPIAQKYMEEHDLTEEEQLPDWFVTSATINPFERVKMQGVWQHYIDASISSTVNLPHEATVEEIEKLYISAWEHKLKGLTIFRDGCKRIGILTTSDSNVEKESKNIRELKRGEIIQCANDLVGKKRKIISGCGPLHVLAYFDPISGELMEVYLNKGSEGGCALYMIGLSRMISLACRAGVDVFTIKDQLDSTGTCPSYAVRTATKHDTSKGSCCPMAIGNALVDMWKEMQEEIRAIDDSEEVEEVEESENNNEKDSEIELCPECGEPLQHSGGCDSCPSCGFSHCG